MGRRIFLSLFVCALCQCDGPRSSIHDSKPVAILSIEGGSLLALKSVEIGKSFSRSLIITNVGMVPAGHLTGRFTVSAFSYTGGVFPGALGTCGRNLDPGQTCTIEFRFAPNYEGTFEEGVRIEYDNGISRITTQTPIIKAAGISIPPGPLTFDKDS